MKKLISAVLLAISVVTFAFGRPALAEGDAVNGGRIFKANCAVCHAGGKNLVNRNKSLSKADLEKYGMYSLDAIKNQVSNGNGAMPAFKGRFKPQQIEDVATYVLSQAEAGWPK